MSARRLKVLFVIKNLQQGGTEGQLLQMLERLDGTLFEYRLCTISSEVHYAALPKVGAIGSLDAPSFGADLPQRLAALIDHYQPDLIHSFRDRVNVQIWRALRHAKHQPAVLMSVRGRPIYPQHLALARLLSRRCFKLTVNSRGVADALIRFGRVPAHRIEIIHNLTDPVRFHPPTPTARQEARRGLDLEDDAFVLLCPARISYVKNQIGLIVSLAMLKRQGRLPSGLRLLMPGRVRDRLPGQVLPWLIRATGLEQHVRIPGPIGNLVPYYHAADAMVLPSWAEGMPNVSLEAHLSGLPVIVTRQGNRDEIVADGETGSVVATGRPGRLADAIARMIATPAGLRREMGERGRQRVLERFACDTALKGMSRVYLQAIEAQVGRIAPVLVKTALPPPLAELPAATPPPVRAARAP